MRRWLMAVLLLTAIYLLVVGSLKPEDWVVGAVLAMLLYAAGRRLLVFEPLVKPPSLWRRLVYTPVFTVAVTGEVLAGTWRVALLTLGLRPARQPRIVAVPIAGRSQIGIAVSGLVHTLTPSSYLVDVDWERKVILFQILDGADPEAACARLQHFYQRYQRPVFP